MKKVNYILLSVVFAAISYMATAEKVALTQGGQSKLSFTQNDYSRLGFKSSVTSFDHFTVKTKDGDFVQITIPGYGQSLVEGYPQLPVMNRLIEVPVGAGVSIKILNEIYQEYNLSEFGIENPIMPAQPPISKSIDNPEDLPFVLNQEIYQTEGYIENDLAVVTYLGEMRGVQLARLEVTPIHYDPVLNKIKVYTELIVEVNFVGGNTVQTIQNKKNLFSPYFESIYKMVSNYKDEISDELIMDEPATYIIVSDPMFETALQPFIQWKTKKGFKVVEAYTNDPGVGTTTATIKSYLQNFYNNPPPGYNVQSFVLIVGDVAQIPTYSGTAGSHVSDLYYFEYTGDLFPECYYGRFSANNLTELQPQIDKTLEYEQYLMPDPSYLDEVVMVAGADGGYQTHSNGQINYGTNHYFNAAHGLYSHTYLQPEPTGGNYSANIKQNVSDGVSYANYTAHCSSNGWADPSFLISDVTNMTNAHQYPLMVGNCCLSNTFNTNCFGEALLRAENKGAVGYIGGSNSTYWDEDYWWGVGFETVTLNAPYNAAHLGAYDRTFHDHGEAINEWFVAQGQMTAAANLTVTQSGSSRKLIIGPTI
ncbi:MAG: C25 family cysteine peptidase [Bacteroidales bacterium]